MSSPADIRSIEQALIKLAWMFHFARIRALLSGAAFFVFVGCFVFYGGSILFVMAIVYGVAFQLYIMDAFAILYEGVAKAIELETAQAPRS